MTRMQHTVTIASPHCRAGTYQSAAHNTETRRHGLGFAMNDIEKKVYGAISKGLTFTERIQRMEYDTGRETCKFAQNEHIDVATA